MSDQIASITLRADVSDLKTASNELDKLGQAAAGAVDKADDLNSVFRAGADSAKKGSEGLKEQQTALKGLLENIDPVTKALNRLDEQQSALSGFQVKGFLGTEEFQHYQQILDDTRLKLTDTGEAAAKAKQELDAAREIERQAASLDKLVASIDPVLGRLKSLDSQFVELEEHFSAGRLSGEQFAHLSGILLQTEQRLTDTGEAAAKAQAELAATQAAERQSAALKGLLGSIDPTIRAFSALDEQYAQLSAHFEAGRINSAQFEHFNGILNQTRERLSGVADVLPEALSRQELAARRAGISVGQYSAAMRTLPAQFTDIATQLAGGQSPFLILLQQGGQIKDQFGGVKGAISGVASYITGLIGLLNPVTVGLAAVAGGFAYLAYQAYENHKEVEALNQALAKTGNISGKSAEGLQALSRQLASARDVSKSVAVDVVTKATALGATADQIKQFSDTALLMTKTTGQTVDELLKHFDRIGKDPVQSLVSLNEQYHFATAALYEHVKALTDAGDSAGATKAIIEQLANSQKSFGDVSVSSLRLTGGWWDDLIDKVGKYKLSLDDLKATPTAGLKEQGIRTGGSELPGWDYVTREAAQPQVPTVEVAKAGLQELINLQQENSARAKQFNDEQLKFRLQMDASEKSLATNAQKKTEEAEKYARAVKAGYITQVEADRHLAQFNERYKDPKAPRTPKTPGVKVDAGDRTLENYLAQARTLTETLETLRQTGETHAKNTELSKQQSHFAELDGAARTRALTAQEKSLLSSREAILNAAKVVDQKNKEVEAQQKINGLAQQANKYVTQMTEKSEALRSGSGLSSRMAQRMTEEAQLRQGWLNGGGKLEDAGFEKELAALRNYYAEEDKLRESPRII